MSGSGHERHLSEQELAPRASVLIESLRDLGYSLQTAVADVVDNSLTAGATRIDLLADTHGDEPAMAILDDGVGMTRSELLEAMRPGSRSPLEERSSADLGRFGLGLKTASFSQCRRLTVLSRKGGEEACAAWDLDRVARTDRWVVELPRDASRVRWSERLGENGTLVVWENLDRIGTADRALGQKDLVRQLDETGSHLRFVFHRFLVPGPGSAARRRVVMVLNGTRIEPYDPFHSRHPATQRLPEEVFAYLGAEVRIQPFTLPHRDKVKKGQWREHAGPGGYLKNQGFYLYRNRRLIVHGTWFGLARRQEVTKLARVQVDIPNSLDSAWKIDVRKASAQPPPQVRERLRGIVDRIGAPSKRIFASKGKQLTGQTPLPVWLRVQARDRISYGLNAEHPLVVGFEERLDDGARRDFRRLLDVIGAAVPIGAIYADESAGEQVGGVRMMPADLRASLVAVWRALAAAGLSRPDREEWLRASEPFRSAIADTPELIDGLEELAPAGPGSV